MPSGRASCGANERRMFLALSAKRPSRDRPKLYGIAPLGNPKPHDLKLAFPTACLSPVNGTLIKQPLQGFHFLRITAGKPPGRKSTAKTCGQTETTAKTSIGTRQRVCTNLKLEGYSGFCASTHAIGMVSASSPRSAATVLSFRSTTVNVRSTRSGNEVMSISV
jgi:hypothetical protein